MLNLSGLYMIRCRITGEYYIGSTARPFHQRFSEHRTQLTRGVCSIPRLQEAVNLYGLDAFEFLPLAPLCEAERTAREREAVETLKPAYNTDGANSRPRYRKWPPITIQGVSYTIGQAAREFGVEHHTIRARIVRGLTGAALVAKPHQAPRKDYTRRA
jgi:hypothetical protein